MTTSTHNTLSKRADRLGLAARMALRLVAVLAIALAAHLALEWAMALADRFEGSSGLLTRCTILITAIVLYALLLAIPFIPGVEIGISLLIMRGAEIAPAIYLATVLGLGLAFLMGRLVPLAALRQFLYDLRMTRAADLLETAGQMTPDERLDALRARLPARLGRWLLRTRYLALGLLLNLPFNAFVGGGGGLSMMAGMSGLLRPRAALLTIALAVLPVPLAVWVMGTHILPQ